MLRRNLLIILTASLSINLALASGLGYFIYQKGGISFLGEKFSRKNTIIFSKYYLAKVAIFKELPNHSSDIYFVGDSITEFGEWHELLLTRNVRNRGISGDTTAGIINRLQEITEGKPAKIFIMCGINNILKSIPERQTIDEYGFIIASFLEMSEQSKIYLQSVLPVNQNKYKKQISKKLRKYGIIKSEADHINKFLYEMAQRNMRIQYVDLAQLTDSSGELFSEFTDDGLHLNGKGLIAWAEIIRPFINE